MRARKALFTLLGLAVVAAAADLVAQGEGGGAARGGTQLVMDYSGPRGLPTNEEGNSATLPPVPAGITVQDITAGDAIFHGKGGCYTCHGPEASGMPDKGSGLTVGLNWEAATWPAIDTTITTGIIEPLTRSTIAMPGRGLSGNLTPDEVRQAAAYVWAISHTRGEPWPGGHKQHGTSATTAPATPTATPAQGTGR